MVVSAFLGRTAGLVLVLLGSTSARLVTYDRVADGPWESYLTSVTFAVLTAITVGMLLAWQFRPIYIWAVVGLVLTLLPGDLWHYTRLYNAAQSASSEIIFQSAAGASKLDPLRWQYEIGSATTVKVADGIVRVESAPDSIGWLEPQIGLRAWGVPPRPWTSFELRGRQPDYTIEWETRFRLDGQFYILVEALSSDGRQILLQARPGQWHITHPTGDRKIVATEIYQPVPVSFAWHKLSLKFGPSGSIVSIDGGEVWRGTELEVLKRLRFGETRSDELHGGEMEIRDVRISKITRPDPKVVKEGRAAKDRMD